MRKSITLIISSLSFLCVIFFQTSCDQKTSHAECEDPPCDQSLLERIRFYTVDDLNFKVFESPEQASESFYNKTYDAQTFLDRFYLPWNYVAETDTTRINEIWNEYFTYESGIAANSPCYTGNLQEYSNKYISELKANLPTQNIAFLDPTDFGITTKTTDLKGLPTDEFCFKSVRNPGEGYPFDYLQLSTLWVGTPIAILARSNDNQWYFVQSTYGLGWVKSESIALTDKNKINTIIESKKAVVVGDHVLLKGKSSTYEVFTGTILSYDETNQEIQFPTKSPIDNKLVFDRIKSPSQFVRTFPLEFNQENVRSVLSQMIGVKYSWGGIDGGRDCSATLKDYFTVFGIWLPRDSKDQRFSGKVDSLQHMSVEEKREKILKDGIPFLSTLYLPGHIVLYVGGNEMSQMLMYHSIWGLKAYHSQAELSGVMKSRENYGIYGLRERENNQVETRPVIGKTVITDVELEKPLRDIPNLKVKPYLENMETLTNPGITNFK